MFSKMLWNVVRPGLTMLLLTGPIVCPAADPDRPLIPRLIVVRPGSGDCPDFKGADAHTLVISPAEPTGALPFGMQDPVEIAAVLETNLAGDIDDPDVLLELATLVATELNESSLSFQDSLLVTSHGVERPEILWNARYPKPTTVKAGSTGDILLLGRFIAEKVDTTSDPIPTDDYGKWRITTAPSAAIWDYFCLAIGWFPR